MNTLRAFCGASAGLDAALDWAAAAPASRSIYRAAMPQSRQGSLAASRGRSPEFRAPRRKAAGTPPP